jgi:nucleoporin NUP42
LGASSSTPAFGKPSAPSQQPSAFGGGGATTNGSTGAFGSQAQSNTATFGRQSSTVPGQRITAFKGRPVTYQRLEKKEGKVEDKKEYPFYHNPSTNKLERIWLPDGPPGPNPDVEASPQTYEALGEALKQLYDFVRDSGTFKDGLVPEVPPKREWVNWEL